MVIDMTTKLRMRISETAVRLIRAEALREGNAFQDHVYFAIARWCVRQKRQPETKRVLAVIPIDEGALSEFKAACSKAGLTMARAVEIAFDAYIAEEGLAPKGIEEPEFDPKSPETESPEVAPVEAEPSRECACTACGHTWTPKGKGQPAYCPRCRSKEWDKVTMCETDCGRPIAPLNTKAGSSTMCEPCYAEMNASWGGEPTE